MRTYAFDFISKSAISAYSSRRVAQSQGNGLTIAANEGELANAIVKTSDMVALYNSLSAPDAQIKKFSDRATAVKRMFALAEAKAIEYQETETMETDTSMNSELKAPPKVTKAERAVIRSAAAAHLKAEKTAAKAEARAAGAVAEGDAAAKAGRGRASVHSGKTISVAPGVEGNPRREGTHGHKSFQIIMNAGGSLSYEDYVAGGGRLNDLDWDIKHNHLTVS